MTEKQQYKSLRKKADAHAKSIGWTNPGFFNFDSFKSEIRKPAEEIEITFLEELLYITSPELAQIKFEIAQNERFKLLGWTILAQGSLDDVADQYTEQILGHHAQR